MPLPGTSSPCTDLRAIALQIPHEMNWLREGHNHVELSGNTAVKRKACVMPSVLTGIRANFLRKFQNWQLEIIRYRKQRFVVCHRGK